MTEPAFAAKLSDKLSGQSAVSQDAAVQAEHTFVFAKRYLNSDRAYSCQGMRILLAAARQYLQSACEFLKWKFVPAQVLKRANNAWPEDYILPDRDTCLFPHVTARAYS